MFWRRPEPKITLLADGFRVGEGRKQWEVRWADVVRVTAFKRDRLSTDLLCLEFILSSGRIIEVNEDEEGYGPLEDALGANLPGGVMPAWRDHVLLPPFAPRVTVIFERAQTAEVREPARGA